jgi:small redox-active disulfide protein 2
MLTITVYGPGCAKCKETEKRVRHIVEASGIDANVVKASDFADMAKAGILMTPAVSINGVVKSTGRIPSEEEIRGWLAVPVK